MTTFRHRGSIMLLVIVFGGIFLMVLAALCGFLLAQNRAQDATRSKAESFAVAEAGLEYYRWYLSHFPGTLITGSPTTTYVDPEAGPVGTYTLSTTANSSCGVTQSITLKSVGVANDTPATSVTLVARYAPPSIATYTMVGGGSEWFYGTHFQGPVHSNGGLRMDETTNNAPVTSAVSEFTCPSGFGCGSSVEPGIFGTGANQDLWSFPTPTTDFTAIATDFNPLQEIATEHGKDLPPLSSSAKPHLGYHLIFNGDNTVTIKPVTAVTPLTTVNQLDSLSGDITYQTDYSLIATEGPAVTYPINSLCGLIFVEDNAWIEGTISGKVTVIAANVTTPGVSPNIVLTNNITYTAHDGSVGLTAIAANDVLMAPDSPFNLTLEGIFVAQAGAFGRQAYCDDAYRLRGTLTMLGTIVSALTQNNYWMGYCAGQSGSSGSDSGYPDANWSFVEDVNNATDPPPFTPTASSQWQFVSWRQQ